MNIEIGSKALVTTNEWFVAPDGQTYRAVFGTVRGVHTAEETLGVKPNGRSSNWYLEIGNMTIAGCQVHYAVRTDACSRERSIRYSADPANGLREYEVPCEVYFADPEL